MLELEPLARAALGGMAAALLAGCVAWSSYLAAWRWLPGAPASARWSAAVVVAGWSLVTLFWLASLVRGFRPAPMLLAWLALAWLGHLAAVRWARRSGAAAPAAVLRADLRSGAGLLRGLGRSWRLVAGAAAAVALLHLLRGLAAPPLAWDSLTYHLVKAGLWVQEGGFSTFRAPGAWGYYGYFAEAGEVLWAWAMLPVRGDLWLAAAGAPVWGAAVLGIYAAARALDAAPRAALLAALAVGATPAVAVYLPTGYVDNVTLAGFAAGSVFVVRLCRGASPGELPLAVAGLALAAGSKLTGVPLLALGGAVALAAAWRSRARCPRWPAVLAATLLAAAPAAPSYARAWLEQGSPLYPFALEVAGVELSAGNPEAVAVGERLRAERGRPGAAEALPYLVYRTAPNGAFLGLGPGSVFLLVLALGAAPALRGARLAPGLYLWAVVLLFAGLFSSGAMELTRTTPMVATAGRYLTPAVAALAVLAAACPGEAARILRAAAVLVAVAWALPRGWARPEAWAVPGAAGAAAIAVLGAGLAVAAGRRAPLTRPRAAAALLVLLAGAGAASAGLAAVRARAREPLYRAAADSYDPAFQMHPLFPGYASAWPLWRALDRPDRGLRLAVAAGFDGLGHNAYLYPLLGTRLQNRVLHVPPAAGGELVDYRLAGELARRASRRCWAARLLRERVDAVVLLAPRTVPEDSWTRSAPEGFAPLPVPGLPGDHAAFRVDRRALRRALGAEPSAVLARCRG